MSVHSGFTTREQEAQYNKNLYSLIFLVQNTLTQILKSKAKLQVAFNEQDFCKYFKNIYEKIMKEEQYKYIPPKFGSAFRDLAQFYDLDTDVNKEMKYIAKSLSENSNTMERKVNSREKDDNDQNILQRDGLEFELKIKLKNTPQRNNLKSSSTTVGMNKILSKINSKSQSRFLINSEYCSSKEKTSSKRKHKMKRNCFNNRNYTTPGFLKTRNKSIPCSRPYQGYDQQNNSKPYYYTNNDSQSETNSFIDKKKQYLLNKVSNRNKFQRTAAKFMPQRIHSSSNSSLDEIQETPEVKKKYFRMDSKTKDIFFKLKNKGMQMHRDRLLKLYNTMDS
ncbi:unnamed protein product [Moneuplotes crassus]|uniref:Uncharacterized protein n=1 Tax=Euplotes crassus TaxID=5936 RepID=A0AAD1URH8_EUPCR|nr:unnamed protein product [Moneuplotes crassus]